MINQNSVTLTLFQPLVYTKEQLTDKQDISQIYSALIKKLDDSEVGSEACIEFSYESNDSINIYAEKAGFALPPTEEVQKAVLEGEEIPLPSHDMKIKEGKYKFIQIPILPEKENLFSVLIPFICTNTSNKKGTFHIRLLKENAIAIIFQIILLEK